MRRDETTWLKPQTKPIADFYQEAARKEDAINGSQRLRNAILICMGITPPQFKPFVRPKVPRPHARNTYPPSSEVERIKRAVAAHYKFPKWELDDPARGDAKISHARHVAVFLSREATGLSLPHLGKLFGGRDHTTILHSIRTIEALIETNARVAVDIDRLREALVPQRIAA